MVGGGYGVVAGDFAGAAGEESDACGEAVDGGEQEGGQDAVAEGGGVKGDGIVSVYGLVDLVLFLRRTCKMADTG